MKKFLIIISISVTQSIFSQAKINNQAVSGDRDEPQYKTLADFPPVPVYPDDIDQVYNTAGLEVKPEFPGGLEAMNSFIKQNFKSPKEGIKGKIYATFIIEKDGSLTNIKILRDLGYETGAEAIRVLKLFPKWSPGQQNNKTIRVLYSIPMIIN